MRAKRTAVTKKQTGETGPPKTKARFMFKMSDLPGEFMDEAGRQLADYSVALGSVSDEKDKKFKIHCSGVLVRKGKRFGILTAHHCVHKPARDFQFGAMDGDKLLVCLKRSQHIVLPPVILVKYALGVPTTLEGPDLAFVEILPSPQLATIQAISSFWSLDQNPRTIRRKFGKSNLLFTIIGFPGVYHDTKVEGRVTRQIIKHMAYFYPIRRNRIHRRNGWDYLEATNWYVNNPDLPSTFGGVSGGPAWGLHLKRDEKTGKFTLKDFGLIGIAFLQTRIGKNEMRLRAHFINSIYSRAWKQLSVLPGHK